MTLLTKNPPLSDFLKSCDVRQEKVTSKLVANASGAAVTIAIGQPMDDNVAVIAANIANADGFAIERVVIPDGTSKKVAVLTGGPASVLVPASMDDLTGAAINMASYATRVAAIGLTALNEPSETEEQTT